MFLKGLQDKFKVKSGLKYLQGKWKSLKVCDQGEGNNQRWLYSGC